MRKIEVIISPFKLDGVKEALSVAGVAALTATEVKGFGRQKRLGPGGAERGGELAPKVKLEIVVPAARASEIVATLERALRTGRPGDGKIFVTGVEQAVRVRTGERGAEAL